MVHCWEEYMWKVHKAVPMDPWADNIQLLDVLIQQRSSPAWLPSWLRRAKTDHMARVGSILNLGTIKDDHSLPILDLAWKQQEVTNTDNGGSASKSSKKDGITGGAQGNDRNLNSDAAAATSVETPKVDTNASPGHGPVAPAAISNVNKPLDVGGHVPVSFAIKSSSLPDIQTSIKSSTSLLASLTGGSSASAQFDVKGSKTVTCNVSGVKSTRVDADALLGLVTPRTTSGSSALWQPHISLPQLSWSSKRGQTLWVVVEIMYANKIRVESDNQGQAKAEAKAVGGAEASASAQAGMEKESLWTVQASEENPMFPIACRLQRLDYDASGNLIVALSRNLKNPLHRNNSVNTPTHAIAMKQTLARSFSLSPYK